MRLRGRAALTPLQVNQHGALLSLQKCCSQRRSFLSRACSDDEAEKPKCGQDAQRQEGRSSLAVVSSDGKKCSEPWREWLTVMQLQRIDTLTYLLGRYPLSDAAAAPTTHIAGLHTQQNLRDAKPAPGPSLASDATATSAMGKETASAAATPVAVATESEAPRSTCARARKTTLRAKKNRLAALYAKALPAAHKTGAAPAANDFSSTLSAATAGTAPCSAPSVSPPSPALHKPRKPPSRLWAQKKKVDSDFSATPAVEHGPFTPLEVVEQLALQWWRKDRRVQAEKTKRDAAEEAAWQALLRHPSHLFADDDAVYARFGMGAYVSPNLPGFTGLFRQQWQDFHVTEMVVTSQDSAVSLRSTSPVSAERSLFCDATPVSRDFDFSIPPLPSELLAGADEASAEGAVAVDRDGDDGGSGGPDPSFFAVDVKQRIQQLRTGDVHERDFAAVSEALSKEKRRLAPSDEGFASEPGTTTHEAKKDSSSSCEASVDSINSSKNGTSGEASHFDEAAFHKGSHFLQCTLHKQHVSHGNALAAIAQTLRIHPRSISVAGIKDYIGDTVQRVRLENVSPASALAANRRFRHKRLRITLSDFSYESAPLSPGDLFGNHFRVVLRDVDVPKSALADAVAEFVKKGFPNYYGCQRFSWFAGRNDAAFALLRHNWLAFAFLFLNFTSKDCSLRELLQRPKKYPHPTQDEYRRGVVRRLRQIAISPADLDVAPFLSCPRLNAPLTHADGRPFNEVEELICAQLREAYFDLNVQSRRLTAQRLSSYLWNQVLTLRLHHLGGEAVLDGDLVAPASIRQLSMDVDDRQDWYHTFGDRVTAENRHQYTIEDVVHPGFSFDAIALPDNVVGAYYEQVCGKYALDWTAQHSRTGLRDFREPPRPIIRKPLNLDYEYNAEARVLTLRFALERGCYANVALSELMKSVRCLGTEEVTVLPLPEALWDTLGDADPGYVTTLQDIYAGYEDGVGFMSDEAPVESAAVSETKPWDFDGPLFLPAAEDPFRKAHRWGSQHLLRNSERREKEAEDMKRLLFDRQLAKQLKEGEVDTYAGHIVPLPPNASAKQVYAKVMRRKRRYAGAPRMVTRMQRSTAPASSYRRHHGAKKLPSFQSLNKNSWNFTW